MRGKRFFFFFPSSAGWDGSGELSVRHIIVLIARADGKQTKKTGDFYRTKESRIVRAPFLVFLVIRSRGKTPLLRSLSKLTDTK